jgi:MFS family permease
MGTWMQNVGQAWLVYQLTHSSVWLGTIGFLQSIPMLFFSMAGGTLADKMSKKKVIVATQVASMIQAFLLAGLVWVGWISAPVVGVLAFTLGIINAFDIPSRQSFVVDMVGKEHLTNAIALNSAIFNSARMIGPAVGGLVIGFLGVSWCFFLNGLSFLAVIAGLLSMKIVVATQGQGGSSTVMESLRESIRYIGSNASLTALMVLVGVLTVFGWSYSVLLPIFADRVLGTGAIGLGNLYTANGLGALISAITIASVSDKVAPRNFFYSGIIIFVGSIMLFAFSRTEFLSLLCMVGVGMGLIAFFATANATLQQNSPDHLRGRVMGLYSLVFQGFFPFGSFGMGVLARGVGVQTAVAIGATICGGSAVIVHRVMKKYRLTHHGVRG